MPYGLSWPPPMLIKDILSLIRERDNYVIGEDDHEPTPETITAAEVLREYEAVVNDLRAEQRKRAKESLR